MNKALQNIICSVPFINRNKLAYDRVSSIIWELPKKHLLLQLNNIWMWQSCGSRDGNSSFVVFYFILFFLLNLLVCVSARGDVELEKIQFFLLPLLTSVCARWCCERQFSLRALNGECGSVWSIWVGKCENVKVIPLLTASFNLWQTSFKSKQTFSFGKMWYESMPICFSAISTIPISVHIF